MTAGVLAMAGLPLLLFGCASTSTESVPDLTFTGAEIRIDSGVACGARNISVGGQNLWLVEFPGNFNFRRHFHNNTIRTARFLGLSEGNIPEYHIYDDASSPNAWAINGGYGNYTVVYGAHLILELAEPVPGTDNLNTAAINATIAHETAHILQYSRGMRGPTKNIELMADAVSGFVASGQERNTRIAIDGLRIAQKYAYESGDFHYTSPGHHGTPAERLDAFMWGYQNGERYIHGEWVSLDEFVTVAAQKFGVSH
ncbi:hypothetical protein [Hyphomonas sp.]|uniref:hypothetical protein n=1 Tax=Hyphomonas sp. TaxID=87 RepID=UPI003D26BD7E